MGSMCIDGAVGAAVASRLLQQRNVAAVRGRFSGGAGTKRGARGAVTRGRSRPRLLHKSNRLCEIDNGRFR
jgi:hypothetical protein